MVYGGELSTPVDVLIGFAQMLETEVTDARRAAHYLLTQQDYAQDSATLLVLHSTVVDNYLWGHGAIDLEVAELYPNLFKELSKLVGHKRGRALTSVRELRDATVHLEERVALRFAREKRWELEHPKEPIARPTPVKWWDSDGPAPAHAIMSWNRTSRSLTIDGVAISVVSLQAELDELNERITETIDRLVMRLFDEWGIIEGGPGLLELKG